MKGHTKRLDRAMRLLRPSFGLLFLLSGCVAHVLQDQQNVFDGEAATKVFAAGYAIMQDKYVEPITSSQIAIAGLNGLAALDPAVKTQVRDGVIQIALPDGVFQQLPAPADDDARKWAAATANVIAIARVHSKPIGARSSEDIYQAVFKSSLAGFDRFSRYLGASAARDERAKRDGYGGIGVMLNFDRDLVLVDSVLPESPAAHAGLKRGDVLLQIDRAEVAAMEKSQIAERLRGRVDSKVSLTMVRADPAQPMTVALHRAHIVNPTVELERRDDIAVIRISGFNQGTAVSVSRAIEQAHRDIGEEIKGFVLDMRDNPGGLLDQAIMVADHFMTSGRIVSTKGRHTNSLQIYDASGRDESRKLPIIVAVNGRSASAAEIVAAALQDEGRAVVVGSNTYGKGTVQNLSTLPNDGELVLTWSYYHAPSGYALHNLGILPNVCTSGFKGRAEAVLDQVAPVWARLPQIMGAWRVSMSGDGDKLNAMRQNCPRSNEVRDLDLDVATRLIADPPLYRRALQSTGSTVLAGPLQ